MGSVAARWVSGSVPIMEIFIEFCSLPRLPISTVCSQVSYVSTDNC